MTAHGTASFANAHRTVVRPPKLLMPGSMICIYAHYIIPSRKIKQIFTKNTAQKQYFLQILPDFTSVTKTY